MKERIWFAIERDRINRKIVRLGKKAIQHEAQAGALYKQIAYLYKEIYKLEQAITAQAAQTPAA
jgi:hypothetical protein